MDRGGRGGVRGVLYNVVVVPRARYGLEEVIVLVRRGDTVLDRNGYYGNGGEEGNSIPGASVLLPV